MKDEDKQFIAGVLDKSRWLMYGDLDEHIDGFAKEVFSHEFSDYGFGDRKMSRDFAVAYWMFLSELVAQDLAEYGTSPRGAWLTDNGKRLKKIVMENEIPFINAQEYIYQQNH